MSDGSSMLEMEGTTKTQAQRQTFVLPFFEAIRKDCHKAALGTIIPRADEASFFEEGPMKIIYSSDPFALRHNYYVLGYNIN